MIIVITKVEGFIINTTDYKESSLVIQLFTKEYGIIGLLAKGVKSIKNKLHASVMKYTYGYFYIYYKEDKLSILKDVDIINPFKKIHEDILAISYLAYYSDLTYQVWKSSPNKEIYHLFLDTVNQLNNQKDPLVLANILETKYLNFLGIGLVLDCCQNCGSTKNIVTVTDGGLICKNCYQNEPIVSIKAIKLLRMYNLIDIKTINSIQINETTKKEVNNFLEQYYQNYSGLYLKSKNFLAKLKDVMSK